MDKTGKSAISLFADKERKRLEAASRLQQSRLLAGYKTATQAANALGVNDRTYAQYENGKRGFKSKVNEFANAFNVSAVWLLTGEKTTPEAMRADPLPPQPNDGNASEVASHSDNSNYIFELFAKKMSGDSLSCIDESDLISISFAAAAEFDKMALGGKGSLKDVIKIAEEIYKIAQNKSQNENK